VVPGLVVPGLVLVVDGCIPVDGLLADGCAGVLALGAAFGAGGVFGFCGAALAATNNATSKGRSMIHFCRLSTLFAAILFETMLFETVFSNALFFKTVFMANSWRANPA
jgi:hypothetical protein